MAKGASKSVVEMLECREGVGEYRRAGGRHRRGVPSGTGDPGEATPSAPSTGLVESPVPGRLARRVREAARGNPPVEIPAGRPESTSHRVTVWLFLAVASATMVWPGEASRCSDFVLSGAVWLPPVRDGWPRNRRGFPGCRGPRASSPGRRRLAPGRRARGPTRRRLRPSRCELRADPLCQRPR
jgi:hypothetical protein